MKELLFILLAFSNLLFSQDSLVISSQDTILSQTGNLTIKVIDISNNDGKIMLAMSDSRENYENYADPKYKTTVKINEGVAKHTFENLPYGEYAIKVFHDENDDNILNKGFMGIPSEDYGFSNNASGSFGPADYDDAKFIFNNKNYEIIISVE